MTVMEMSASSPLDELLINKKISREQYVIYNLFNCSELGREFLKSMTEHLFMAHVEFHEFPTKLPYIEGGRAIFKDIKAQIEFVSQKLKEPTQ